MHGYRSHEVHENRSATNTVLVAARSSELREQCTETLRRHGIKALGQETHMIVEIRQSICVVVIADKSPQYALDCVRACRKARISDPILIVTSERLKPHLAVHAFAAGSDDFVPLPFNEHELVARTAAMLARNARDSLPDLTRTEYAIFQCLSREEGRWLDSQEIIRLALGTSHAPDTALVRVHIHNIRRKLLTQGIEIRSRKGRGYMLLRNLQA